VLHLPFRFGNKLTSIFTIVFHNVLVFFNKGNLTGILLAIFIPVIAITLILFGLFYYVRKNKGSNLFSVFSRKGKLPIDDSYEDMQMK
jgi:hypothetical protein